MYRAIIETLREYAATWIDAKKLELASMPDRQSLAWWLALAEQNERAALTVKAHCDRLACWHSKVADELLAASDAARHVARAYLREDPNGLDSGVAPGPGPGLLPAHTQAEHEAWVAAENFGPRE